MRMIARIPVRYVALALTVAILAPFVPATNAEAAMTLTFSTSPVLGTLPGITLSGGKQTTTATTTLNHFAVTSSGTPNIGWNMTVASVTGTGKSSVFKEYCPNTTCGTDSGPGYVTGGYTLPADSLTLDTAAASITGSGATKPTFQCNTSPFCDVDTTTQTKIVSATFASSLTTWTSSGNSTLSLTTPANLHKLQTGETYRVDLLWTLSTGP
jgi:hypothetical protein